MAPADDSHLSVSCYAHRFPARSLQPHLWISLDANFSGENYAAPYDDSMSDNNVTMYSTTWCGYCRNLKKQLDAKGIGYTEINIEEDPAAADRVEKVNGGNQVVPTLEFSDGSTLTNPSASDVQKKLAEIS